MSTSPRSPDESIHHFFGSAGSHRRDQRIRDKVSLLSNVTPQVGRGFNRDKWEHLAMREEADQTVQVCVRVHQLQVLG